MKILAVDSSAVSASAAIVEDGKVLGEFYLNTSLTHSQTLMPMVENVLECTRIPLSDIDLFAVSSGPGSFTGIRIGVASVKGLAMAQKKPCVGVSTLEAMAYNAAHLDGIIAVSYTHLDVYKRQSQYRHPPGNARGPQGSMRAPRAKARARGSGLVHGFSARKDAWKMSR